MTARVVDRNEKDLSKLTVAINELASGRSNAAGTFALTANATTTVVTAPTCGAGSVPLLTPLTAHAATELGNGTLFVSAIANGAFTVTHANNAQTDRTFGFVCLG
jgi:hypothetical protein